LEGNEREEVDKGADLSRRVKLLREWPKPHEGQHPETGKAGFSVDRYSEAPALSGLTAEDSEVHERMLFGWRKSLVDKAENREP
jgi:hypothetical protein